MFDQEKKDLEKIINDKQSDIEMKELANIELKEPTNDSSPIKKFLEKRGSGLHHIALETQNIEGEVSRMEGCGIQFLGKIRDGSAGTKVTFIHPKSLNGVLTELCANE